MLRYCRGLLSPSRAEDAVQHVFINAHGALVEGSPPRDLRPWLYRIAHNVALNALREGGWDHPPIDERWSTRGRFEEDVERREELARALSAVRALPPRQRDALLLRELEGRSHEEIAAALGVTGGAVRQLLHRSRANLRAVATALTPPQLVERLVAWGSGGGAATPARLAELAAGGAGATASLVKLGAAAVVTGAVAGVGLSAQSPVEARPERPPRSGETLADTAPDRGKASATTGHGSGRAERRRSDGSESGRGRGAGRRGRASGGGGFRGSSGSGHSESSASSGSGSSSGDGSGSAGSSGSGSGSGSPGSGSSGSSSSGTGSSGSGPSPPDSSGGSSGSGSGSSGSSSGSGSSGSGSDRTSSRIGSGGSSGV